MSIVLILYLGLFALSSAASIADELSDARFGRAALTMLSHIAGFLLALGLLNHGVGQRLLFAAPLMLVAGFCTDVWSSRCCASGVRANESLNGEVVADEVCGVGLLLALRVPGYLSGLLLVVTGGMGI